LTITHDIAEYGKAMLFSQVGKQSKCFMLFSVVAGERGAAAQNLRRCGSLR
jgi:catalase